MKVITILGSPKKNGKTAKALDLFEEKLISKEGVVERIHVTDYEMNGCLGCYSCVAKEAIFWFLIKGIKEEKGGRVAWKSLRLSFQFYGLF